MSMHVICMRRLIVELEHFDVLQVFDKEWHKVHFGVHRERVVLYVDCELSEELPLDIRGKIDVNGEIAISKVAGTRRTVPVSDTAHYTDHVALRASKHSR